MGMFGSHGRSAARKRAHDELARSPSWQVLVEGRGWVCPLCAQVALQALPEAREAQVDAALEHLEGGCPGWRGGEGQERPLPELRKVAAARELRRRVKTLLVQSPSWQLIDVGRQWYCPYCGDGAGIVVPTDKRMTEETLLQIVGHVDQCYAFRGQGEEKPLAHLKTAVKHVNQSKRLVENVRKKLEGDPAWRRKDPRQRWVCPYCLAVQEQIDLSTNIIMFENAPAQIAKHLAAGCEAFKAGKPPAPLDPNLTLEPVPDAPRAPTPIRPGPAPLGLRSDSGKLPALVDSGPHEIPETDPVGRGNRRAEAKGGEVDTVIFDEEPLTLPLPQPTQRFQRGQLPERVPEREREPRATEPRAKEAPRAKEPPKSDDLHGVWGRDAAIAEKSKRRGMTPREIESSGDMLYIDDPEVRRLTARSPSGRFGALDAGRQEPPAREPVPERDDPRAPPERARAETEATPRPRAGSGSGARPAPDARRPAAEWRQEIERELAKVKSLAPGGSGEHHAASGDGQRAEDDLRDTARALRLAERGVEVRRIVMPAQPARGDFVDLMPLAPDQLALVAGGVMGDEAEGPLVAAMARNLLRQRVRRDLRPAEVLRHANRELFPELDGRLFMGLLVGLVDLTRRTLTLARAGLPDPLLVNPAREDELTVLHTEGMVLGIDRGPIFDTTLEEQVFDLTPGDLVVVFTSGLVEARSASRDELGLERLHHLSRRYGTHEADYWGDKLREALDAFLPEPPHRTSDAVAAALRFAT